MDRVFFVVKRAHLATLRFSRKVLAPFGLTPARFDVLYALTESEIERTQSGLRRALDVARATISEMLTTLERLGLVARTRGLDRRTWEVTLTAKGQSALDAAVAHTMDDGLVPLTVDGILAEDDVEVDPAVERDALEASVRRLRDAFGDGASWWLYRPDLDCIEGSLTSPENPFSESLPIATNL